MNNDTQAPADTEAPIGVEHETIFVVPPPSLDELLKRADSIASALRGSRVNYHVEQEAAATIWELIEAVRLSAAPATDATEAPSERKPAGQFIPGFTAEESMEWCEHYKHDLATPAPAVGASPDVFFPCVDDKDNDRLNRIEALMQTVFDGKEVPQVWFKRADVLRIVSAAVGASVQPVPATAADQMLGRYAEQADEIKELLDTHAPYTTGNIRARVAQLLLVQPVQASLSETWIVVKEHVWEHDDGGRPTLAYLWPTEFERATYPTFEAAAKFINDGGWPVGWVAVRLNALASSTPTNPTKAE